MLQKLVTVQPTYGRHYTFDKPALFPEASGEIPQNAIPGKPLLIRGPDGMYETSINLSEATKPGDKYQVTWSEELYKVNINKDVGKHKKFSVTLSDGSDIQVQNPISKTLKKGDTIDVWIQKPNVRFMPQLQKKQGNIAKRVIGQVKKECEQALKAKEEEARENEQALKAKQKELEKKLETCEKAREGLEAFVV